MKSDGEQNPRRFPGEFRAMASSSHWTQVSRRKGTQPTPSSPASQTPTNQQPPAITPYPSKPTYAQILSRKPTSSKQPELKRKATLTVATTPRSTPPTPPPSPRSRSPPPVHLVAAPNPGSPTKCRFPPSTHFEEWRERCFRCFKLGHRSAKCPNPKRCTVCLAKGHKFQHCPVKATLMTPIFTPKTGSIDGKASALHALLHPSEPRANDMMPPAKERPAEVTCHVTRDMAFADEIVCLQNSLVITQPPDFEGELTGTNIAALIATSGLVTIGELAISRLPGGKFLVLPPSHINALTLGNAIPDNIWDKGFLVEIWSPHLDSTVEFQNFKLSYTLMAYLFFSGGRR